VTSAIGTFLSKTQLRGSDQAKMTLTGPSAGGLLKS
jgi:hypothetical protein